MFPVVLVNFLGAFLLFQIELVVAKHLLPWYGGSAAVWTTSMLFFQAVLLAGYGFVHRGSRQPSGRMGIVVQLAAAVFALIALTVEWLGFGDPLLATASLRPAATDNPVMHLLFTLAVTAGLPCFVLSMTSPLTQRWFSACWPSASPYRLYALSNTGSLMGLISYPLCIEPFLPVHLHARVLAVLFAAYGVVLFRCAFRVRPAVLTTPLLEGGLSVSPSRWIRLAWVGLSALGSALLLAVTNHLCQDVAVVPFLWVLPLTLYLLSFMLCFGRDGWYSRRFFVAVTVAATAATLFVLIKGLEVPIVAQIAVVSVLLFGTCMVCHGELVRLKPAANELTAFYLAISLGGVLGGLLVSVVAPLCLRGFWEFHAAIWAFWTFVPLVWLADETSALRRGAVWFPVVLVSGCVGLAAFLARPQLLPLAQDVAGRWGLLLYVLFFVLVAVLLTSLLYQLSVGRRFHPAHPGWVRAGELGFWGLVSLLLLLQRDAYMEDVRIATRNFYGVLRVVADDEEDKDLACLSLQHGRIRHGKQFVAAEKRRLPTMYYTEESGVGVVLRTHPAASNGLRVAAIGLGAGTVASYGRTNDLFTFYEINSAVIALSSPGGPFTYLRDAACRVNIVEGDARLALERAWATNGPAGYHVLIADAFSGDSIPAHLLTREAVDLYLRHLAPDGVLCLHISNRYLDLKPLARALADTFDLQARCVNVFESDERVTYSTWILLFRRGAPVGDTIAHADDELPAATKRFEVWTDDYSNLIGLLK